VKNRDIRLPRDLFGPRPNYIKCDSCGEVYPEGAWPYCKSKQNPGGHSTEVNYGWHF